MVTVFTVVGEHQVDATRLLVLGADGHYYEYRPTPQRFLPVDPDRAWVVYGRSSEARSSVNRRDESSGSPNAGGKS